MVMVLIRSMLQHQLGDHPRYDASLKESTLRRPTSPDGRPGSVHCFQPYHRRGLPISANENQRKEGYGLSLCSGISDGHPGADVRVTTDMTTLKYVEPAPMGSAEEPKLITTTVHSYDLQQIRGLWKSQLMGVGMMGVMHLYFKYTNPLLIQSIIPLKGAFEGNLVKIHLFGSPAIGDLKRPWKAAGGMMGMGGDGPKADKKSIEQAERAGSGGVKDE